MVIYNKPFLKLREWINIDKLNWFKLSKNYNSIDLLRNNLDKINWYYLTENINAIDLLENYDEIYDDKIFWSRISKNYNAISILSDNLDKIEVTIIGCLISLN